MIAKMQNLACVLRMPRVPQAIQASNSGHTTYMPTANTTKKTQNMGAYFFAGALLTTLLLFGATETAAQVPYPWTAATATQTAGTIAAGGAFQTALAANPNRKGCLVQNTSSHVLYVYFGTLAAATTSNAMQVAAAGVSGCNYGPSVITGAVNVTTSTTSDTFVVLSFQ